MQIWYTESGGDVYSVANGIYLVLSKFDHFSFKKIKCFKWKYSAYTNSNVLNLLLIITISILDWKEEIPKIAQGLKTYNE